MQKLVSVVRNNMRYKLKMRYNKAGVNKEIHDFSANFELHQNLKLTEKEKRTQTKNKKISIEIIRM